MLRKLFRGVSSNPKACRSRVRRLLLEKLEDRRVPCTIEWVGDGDGISWNDSGNWDTGILPGPSDEVCIASFEPTVIQASSDVSIRSIESFTALTFSSSLSLTAGSTVNLPGLGGGLTWTLSYANNAVTLHVE